MSKIIRRRYTAEYRDQAVRWVTDGKETIASAARKLELSEKTLANWVRRRRSAAERSDGAAPAAHSVSELEAELSRLRAENARLKIEREILKKATAFFAKESP